MAPRAASRRRLGALAAGVLAFLGACGSGGEDSSRALYELERLAFVPPAACTIDGYRPPYHDHSLDAAILVDLYEVTRGDWLRGEVVLPEEALAAWDEQTDAQSVEWPATWMTRAEAREFARGRGMRLLTAREWIHVALGRRVHAFPYGASYQEAWANTLDLGLRRPVPVGTFESGRSRAYGAYDLAGNAAEWVDGWVPGYGDRDERTPGTGCALGGSYNDRLRRTYGPSLAFFSVTLDPEHRAADVGLRCAADAREYLWAMAPRWGSGADAERRVRRVAEDWVRSAGRDAVLAVVRELADRDGAPEEIGWLLDGAR
ncbi:MAG: SUMF1/EgtB/PvdO family nonheme iron enzyme [Planctomycetota bacterium]